MGVAGLLATAAILGGCGEAKAPRAGQELQLTATAAEVGWISFTVAGPAAGTAELREQVGSQRRFVARIPMTSGTGGLRHAAHWRCDRRERTFIVTRVGGGAGPASTTITTPSCAHRLGVIVTPGQVRPGQATNVRVSDPWHIGAVSARVCATSGSASAGCKTLRLKRGRTMLRARMRLPSAGSWAVGVRTRFGQRVTHTVAAKRGARIKTLLAGDSMVYGIFEDLDDLVKPRGGSVTGDPNPGSGISKPELDWLAHARDSAASERPDATIVFLGTADDRYPLKTPSGQTLQYGTPAWSTEYVRRVRAVMTSYQRAGKGLVYWLMLPAHRDPGPNGIFLTVDRNIRRAAAGFDDGVRVIDKVAEVLAPDGKFQRQIRYHGRLITVRADDGYHLAPAGRKIAAAILFRAMREDGMLQGRAEHTR